MADVLGGVGGAEAIGEPGEHIVRRRSPSVDQTVGQTPRPPTDRLEGEDDDDSRCKRRDVAALAADPGPTKTTTARYTAVISATTAPNTTVFLITMSRSRTRYFKIAMPRRDGDPDQEEEEEDGEHDVAEVDARDRCGDSDEGNDRRCGRDVGQPPELLSLLTAGTAEPQDESDHGGDAGDDEAKGAGGDQPLARP